MDPITLATAVTFDYERPEATLPVLGMFLSIPMSILLAVVIGYVLRRFTKVSDETWVGIPFLVYLLVGIGGIAAFCFLGASQASEAQNDHTAAVVNHLSTDYGITVTGESVRNLLDGDILLTDQGTGDATAITLVRTATGGIAVLDENSDVIEPLTK